VIPGPALAAWLADPDAQIRARAAVEAFGDEWSVHPLMTGLERALSLMPVRTPELVIDAARAFLDKTVEIDQLITELIAASRKDPFFRPPFAAINSDIHSGLLLFNNPELMISYCVCGVDRLAAKKSGPRGATSISFTGTTTLFRYLKGGGATLAFWECAPITENFVAAQAGKCRFVGHRRIEDGDELVVDGRYQSFIIEHASSDMVYFQATASATQAPVIAEYDSKSLSFIGASSADEVSSRVQMMVSLLRAMAREDALPLIEEALASPHFYTRWYIMREYLAMDAEAALPSLRRMAANDRHPEVRAAARQTLELFFEDEVAAAAERGDYRCRA
jgi:hypothetical protein